MRSFRPALRPGALAAGLVLLLGTSAGAQSDILLQLESGSPAGDRFVVDSAGGFVARGAFNRGTIPVTGAGVRLMWYPRKAAFRAGYVEGERWNDASIGYYSVATGYNTTASGDGSTSMGYSTTASGVLSTAMGANTTASGYVSTAMGIGTTASESYSTAMGFGTRASGNFSTAMGARAVTAYGGSFVYGDASGSTTDTVRASTINQATWRTTGGFRVFTNTGLTTGCSIAAAGTAWSCTSSRLEKENFAEVDGEEVLRRLRAVPVTSWNGIAEGPEVRHIGPMAQDWHAAFALNDDPLTLHQGDMAGVSLAAVQALDGRTRNMPEMELELARLREENHAMRREATDLREDAAVLRDDATALRAEAAALHEEVGAQRARLERLEALVAALTMEP
jgi:trimeric autotransporter adhesin